jgi:hypothetical protein
MLKVGKLINQGLGQISPGIAGFISLLAATLVGLPAEASVPLTRADVESLHNRVEFIPRGRTARAARQSDFLAVGDALRTARLSQADLRFNDGSLARVGERATFRFVPNTRNFRLTNGTVLLLIPPGRGRTNIQTPSAVTGIQGSAVVARYIPESDLTLIMALTNNVAGPMTITTSSCADGGAAACNNSEYALHAGQMALIQNGQVQVVEFDLNMFHETSPLLDGLELDNPSAESPLGAALEQVRQETVEALEDQIPFSEGMTLNPAMIGVGSTSQLTSHQSWLLSPSGGGISPLTTLNGALTPGQALVTNITQPFGESPQPIQMPTSIPSSAVSSGSGGSSLSPVPTVTVNGGGTGGGGIDVGAGGGTGGGVDAGAVGGTGGGVDVGAGGSTGGGVGVGAGGNNGVGVGVGGDPGNNNGVGPDGNNGVGVGVGSDPGNNNGVGVGVGSDPGNNNGVGPDGNNGAGGGTDPFVPPNK